MVLARARQHLILDHPLEALRQVDDGALGLLGNLRTDPQRTNDLQLVSRPKEAAPLLHLSNFAAHFLPFRPVYIVSVCVQSQFAVLLVDVCLHGRV